MNIQTGPMATRIAFNKYSTSPQTSYVYSLRSDDTANPLLLVRLQPNGLFSCAPVSADTVLYKPNAILRLEFEYTLPITTPLPSLPGTSSFLRKALRATREAAKNNAAASFDTSLWNALKY